MKKLVVFAFVFLVACAPQQVRSIIVYAADRPSLIDLIAATASNTKAGFNYKIWNVTGITESSISLGASRLLSGTPDITMVWTFVTRSTGTVVAVDTVGANKPRDLEQPFFNALDAKFQRIPMTP
jgi:hypothetical protein